MLRSISSPSSTYSSHPWSLGSGLEELAGSQRLEVETEIVLFSALCSFSDSNCISPELQPPLDSPSICGSGHYHVAFKCIEQPYSILILNLGLSTITPIISSNGVKLASWWNSGFPSLPLLAFQFVKHLCNQFPIFESFHWATGHELLVFGLGPESDKMCTGRKTDHSGDKKGI